MLEGDITKISKIVSSLIYLTANAWINLFYINKQFSHLCLSEFTCNSRFFSGKTFPFKPHETDFIKTFASTDPSLGVDLAIYPLPSSRLTSKKKSVGRIFRVQRPGYKSISETAPWKVDVCFSSVRTSKMKNPSSMLNQDVNILSLYLFYMKVLPFTTLWEFQSLLPPEGKINALSYFVATEIPPSFVRSQLVATKPVPKLGAFFVLEVLIGKSW